MLQRENTIMPPWNCQCCVWHSHYEICHSSFESSSLLPVLNLCYRTLIEHRYCGEPCSTGLHSRYEKAQWLLGC